MPGEGYPSDCELTEALRARAMHRNRPVERSAIWLAECPGMSYDSSGNGPSAWPTVPRSCRSGTNGTDEGR